MILSHMVKYTYGIPSMYTVPCYFFLVEVIRSKEIQFILHSERRDQRMRQVVAYKRLKTMENH